MTGPFIYIGTYTIKPGQLSKSLMTSHTRWGLAATGNVVR